MVMNERSLRVSALVLVLLLGALGLGAQTLPGTEAPPIDPVEEEEIESFAIAYIEIQSIQVELNEQINSRLEESTLGAERFYAINEMAQNSGPEDGFPGVSDEELAEYRDVLQDVLTIQESLQNEMVEVVTNEELTTERFNEIIAAIQQDPDLAERVQTYLERETQS